MVGGVLGMESRPRETCAPEDGRRGNVDWVGGALLRIVVGETLLKSRAWALACRVADDCSGEGVELAEEAVVSGGGELPAVASCSSSAAAGV